MGGSRDVSPTGRGGSPTAAAAAAAAAGAVKALSDEQAAEQDQEEVRNVWAHVGCPLQLWHTSSPGPPITSKQGSNGA